ncbi:MAG TPA: tRNA uridine-5-carboxymethylaminomethyl(34) synthesis enzyme MnmG, partial [Gemmataceae bacterium]|nr:tRNA uridine-5-carboxymethylaminomethyl(34) synthesis enzyme MnmG [Gemmataceae bacterium]
FEKKEAGIAQLQDQLRKTRSDGDSLATWLRRTGVEWADLCERHPPLREWNTRPDVVEQVCLEAKYSGYIERQAAEVERFQRMENKRIPTSFDFTAVPQLRHEAKEKLNRVRPTSLGQASRISGITPADLAVLLFYLD